MKRKLIIYSRDYSFHFIIFLDLECIILMQIVKVKPISWNFRNNCLMRNRYYAEFQFLDLFLLRRSSALSLGCLPIAEHSVISTSMPIRATWMYIASRISDHVSIKQINLFRYLTTQCLLSISVRYWKIIA